MNLTIDASVFVSAARPSEKLYPISFRFLHKVKNSEKSFEKGLACGGQLVEEMEKLLRGGSNAG